MRYLGVDYGQRRIGLAIGDDVLRIASPLGVVESNGHAQVDARKLIERARREGVEAIVVGLPLNMNDSEGPQAALTRKFINALRAASELVVHEQDERLSSAAADDAMNAAGLTPRQQASRRDMLAAQVILQAFLDRTR